MAFFIIMLATIAIITIFSFGAYCGYKVGKDVVDFIEKFKNKE
jgi:hypothetical protein